MKTLLTLSAALAVALPLPAAAQETAPAPTSSSSAAKPGVLQLQEGMARVLTTIQAERIGTILRTQADNQRALDRAVAHAEAEKLDAALIKVLLAAPGTDSGTAVTTRLGVAVQYAVRMLMSHSATALSAEVLSVLQERLRALVDGAPCKLAPASAPVLQRPIW